MSPHSNVDLVTTLLIGAGYTPLEQPIIVGGIPFESTAILAKDSWLELVVVVDTVLEDDTVALNANIYGLARALDLVESRRALTVVLVGPSESQTLDGELKDVARVLSVPSGAGDGTDSTLRHALAVLLPLDLVAATDEPIVSWSSVRESLRDKYSGSEIEPIFKAIPRGPDRVRTALRDALIEAFNAR